MRLFLIRHAETVDNVAHVLAGTTDSNLTSHGALQIERLAQYFRSKGIQFTRVFSSDLKRAVLTAEGICTQQPVETGLTPVVMASLREKDFGSLEGTKGSHHLNPSDALIRPESEGAMKLRSSTLLNDHLLPLLFDDGSHQDVVAVVSHGIILRVLWRSITELFPPNAIDTTSSTVRVEDLDSDTSSFNPVWSNTGFLELSIQRRTTSINRADSQQLASHAAPTALLAGWSLKVLAVNCNAHLSDLRRTQGGIGSAAFDHRQQRIDRFFRS